MYRSERSLEVAALCDPRVRATIAEERIELRQSSLLDQQDGGKTPE
jgi:hypothetical protein